MPLGCRSPASPISRRNNVIIRGRNRSRACGNSPLASRRVATRGGPESQLYRDSPVSMPCRSRTRRGTSFIVVLPKFAPAWTSFAPSGDACRLGVLSRTLRGQTSAGCSSSGRRCLLGQDCFPACAAWTCVTLGPQLRSIGSPSVARLLDRMMMIESGLIASDRDYCRMALAFA